MSTLAQFAGGYGPITSIVNFFSGGGTSTGAVVLTPSSANNCKEFLSGALTAGNFVTVPGLNLTGRGRVNFLTAYTKDATNRTVGCKIIVDGVTIYNATSALIGAAGAGVVPIGTVDSSGAVQQFGQILFYQSFVVQVATSVASETDKIGVGINYETWA